jgi:hypothetical protein
VTSKLVLVRVVREAGIEGKGTPARGSTGGQKKGTRSRINLGLLLQLCDEMRALSYKDC